MPHKGGIFRPLRVVVTGGPSGGKTTFIELLKREYAERIAIVPEAATILYLGGFPRIKTLDGRLAAQRSIFHVQRELEELIGKHFHGKMIVCDRGSLDGAAYWPHQSKTTFFDSLGTTLETELARYDVVLHLDTADKSHYDTSNPVRTENFEEACRINEAILKSWARHPMRVRIGHNENFLKKIEEALAVVDGLIKAR